MNGARKFLYITVASLVAVSLYLLLWPVPVNPVSWEAPVDNGFIGVFKVNTGLSDLRFIDLNEEGGPEHIVVGPDGMIYAAVASGKVLRFSPEGTSSQVAANTGGRVLGFDFDHRGRLIAADAIKGLLAINPDGKVHVLANQLASGEPILFADGVVVAPDGKVYFTDASTRFSPRDWGGTFEASILDIMEQSATGRVLVFDPETEEVSVVAQGFSFANGIALSTDAGSIYVAESGKYRVWKIDSAARNLDVGKPSTRAHILLSNLPGYPDNLMRGESGRIWLGLAKPRDKTVDRLSKYPFLRELILRMPRFLWPVPKRYGHVIAFDESGRIIKSLQDPEGRYPETTGVTETKDRLYIQSLHAEKIGWMPIEAAGIR